MQRTILPLIALIVMISLLSTNKTLPPNPADSINTRQQFLFMTTPAAPIQIFLWNFLFKLVEKQARTSASKMAPLMVAALLISNVW